MRDRDIAASLAAGDPDGLAAAYDHHAVGLYGYCRSLLGEPADAADAVQDTFIIAIAKLAGLRSPARLRSWLYAIARNECQSRLRAGAWPARVDAASELAAPVTVAGTVDSGQGELRYLVLDALGRLNPDEREVAELSRRHGLDNADLAGVLGVPVRQAHALAVKTGEDLDRSLGTLLVAGTGWGACPGLDALLDGWDGRPTVVWRTRAGRHIDGCEVCGERRRKVLSPAMLLRLLPLALLPDGLREQVLWLVPDGSPEAASYRDEVIGRTGPVDPAGFPVQIAPAGWTGRSGRAGRADGPPGPGLGWRRSGDRPALRRLALVAALLVLVSGGGIAAFVLHGGGPSRMAADSAGTRPLSVPGAPGGSAHPGPGLDPARPISAPPGGRSPSPGASAPAVRSSAPGPQRPRPPASSAPVRSTAPKASAPPKPKPPPPVLSESPGTVSMAESTTNIWTGSFTVTAANGPVSFRVSAPSGVTVSEAGGTVSPGFPVTIRVTYSLVLMEDFPPALTVNDITVSLSYQK
ncbi:MAG TPA: sigma-70 family RNA polymerase sigma factor, partial [Streptosporangiaceae bacterium]|nr:sigma-70 family RNA polymerase sigma factor [Streptosporangiaceae bacterium]